MSRVLAEVAGKLATWLGYDGTDFRNVHVDADGDLQVDVLTTAMSALAATAANQATMITALQKIDDLQDALDSIGSDALRVMGGIDGVIYRFLHVDGDGDVQVDVVSSALPTGAATDANQTTMITALQLIDDLRNALDSVGTDELDVNVEASVLPTGAATSAWQDTLNDGLAVLGYNFPLGEKWNTTNATVNVATATWTVVKLYTVPAGKVCYWMGAVVGMQGTNDPFTVRFYRDAGNFFESWVQDNPFVCDIGLLARRTAGQTFSVQVRHTAGANRWVAALMTFIEVDA